MTFHEAGQSLADIERDYILETLAHCQGNRTHTAKILKISVRSLRMKLQNYSLSGIEVVAPGKAEETSGISSPSSDWISALLRVRKADLRYAACLNNPRAYRAFQFCALVLSQCLKNVAIHKEAAGDKLDDLQLATVACERRNAAPGDTPIGFVIVLEWLPTDTAPICHEPADVFLRLLSLLAVHLSVSLRLPFLLQLTVSQNFGLTLRSTGLLKTGF